MKEELPHQTRRWTIPFFVAWLLFVVSMFVPGVSGELGWECAWIVFDGLLRITEMQTGSDYYLISLNFSNFAMLLSPLAVRFYLSDGAAARWISYALCLCTGLVIAFSLFAETRWSFDLEIGYFLWAGSFIILSGEWMRQMFLRRLANAGC